MLEEAFTGHFTDHHAFLLAKMLARVDAIDADIAELDTQIEAEIGPFAAGGGHGWTRSRGSSRTAAHAIIAEIGVDMTRFPTAGHLASWAKFAPGVKESAGKKKGRRSTGHGNPYLARILGNAAAAAGKTDTFLGDRYRRIARRRGTNKAIVAVGRSILVIIWHLLSDPDARFHDLGADFYAARIDPERRKPQPHPPPRSPRLQGHPRTRRLTTRAQPHPAPLRPAGCCACPVTAPISVSWSCGFDPGRPLHPEPPAQSYCRRAPVDLHEALPRSRARCVPDPPLPLTSRARVSASPIAIATASSRSLVACR